MPHATRQALLRDWELVQELALAAVGERYTQALACFVASGADYSRVLRLAWPVRQRAFFEDRFVLWPLQQILDQSDRYAICLTDKDEARLFLYDFGRIEEVKDIVDEIPGRVRFPDPYHELEYMRKIIEHTHHHFDRVAELALRLLRREPFEHLIIGGLWEKLPDFESRLHRYLRDRIVARWDINVHKPNRGDQGEGPAGGAAVPGRSGPADLEGDQGPVAVPWGPGPATRSRPCGSVASSGCSRSRTSRGRVSAAPPAAGST